MVKVEKLFTVGAANDGWEALKQKPPDFLAGLAACAGAAPNTVLPNEFAITGGVSTVSALLATPPNSIFVEGRSLASATFTADAADPNPNGNEAPPAPVATLPNGDAFAAPNLNFDAFPSSTFGPLNMKPPPAGCEVTAVVGAGAALPPKPKTDGWVAVAKLGGAALLVSNISVADLSGDGVAAGALELVPNWNGGGTTENVEATDSGGVSDDFKALVLAATPITLLPNSSGVVVAEVVATLPPKLLFVWFPNNLTEAPLLLPKASDSALDVAAAAAAAKDRWVSLASFEEAGVKADVDRLVTNALFELLTTLAPPFVTAIVSLLAAKPLDGSLLSTDENRATFFLGVSVDELISLNGLMMVELFPLPLSSPFSLLIAATAVLGAANLGVLKSDASLASNGFFELLVLDTSLKMDKPSFFSAAGFSLLPNDETNAEAVFSNGFFNVGVAFAVLVSGAFAFGKPNVKEATGGLVTAPVSTLDTDMVAPSPALVAGWLLLDLMPNVKVAGVLAAVDMAGVPKLIDPAAGLSDTPNLNEFV